MPNILIIEDDKYLVDDLQFFVQDKGEDYTCYAYNSADEVLENWDKLGKIDTIILDLMMLKGELKFEEGEHETWDIGEILFDRIRREFPGICIIVITSRSDDELNINVKGVEVIYKPMTEEKIKRLLDLI